MKIEPLLALLAYERDQNTVSKPGLNLFPFLEKL